MQQGWVLSGKLSPDSLTRNILAFCGAKRPEVLVGAAVGEDAAVLEWPQGKLLVFASDPIVGATANAGRLLVRVNVNDIASKGGEPAFMVVTLILPPHMGELGASRLMREIHEECLTLGIAVVGGHTEFNDLYEHPVLMGAVLGTADRVLSADAIRPGDEILITKHVGIEGMSILAADREDLLSECLSPEEIAELLSWGEQTCVLEESRLARMHAKFMHDPTEGGVWGGIAEICSLGALGVKIQERSIPINGITQKAAAKLDFNPLHLIASGSLLIVVSPEHTKSLLSIFSAANIRCARIGFFVERDGDTIPMQKEELWGLLKKQVSDIK